jgi:hypothetical protein
MGSVRRDDFDFPLPRELIARRRRIPACAGVRKCCS